MTEKQWICVILGIILLGFVIGWLFPVEGPFDYVYDDYASQPAHKRSAPSAPLNKDNSIIININDLSEEDFEALQEVFANLK